MQGWLSEALCCLARIWRHAEMRHSSCLTCQASHEYRLPIARGVQSFVVHCSRHIQRTQADDMHIYDMHTCADELKHSLLISGVSICIT